MAVQDDLVLALGPITDDKVLTLGRLADFACSVFPKVCLVPIAVAGLNRDVTAGDVVELDGSLSNDPSGDPLSYQWSFVSTPVGSLSVLSSPTAVKPTFTPDLAGSYIVQLVVNDGRSDSQPSTMSVTASRNTGMTPADFLAELNRFRAAAGFKPMALNAELMQATASHAGYLVSTYQFLSDAERRSDPHTEIAGKTGFKGVTSDDRAKAAGYVSQTGVGEEVNLWWHGALNNNLVENIRILMNAPYHGLGLMTGQNEIGVSYQADSRFGAFVVAWGSRNGTYENIPPGEVRMWPCNGVTNILNRTLTNETPSPIEGRNLETTPIGTPIYVAIRGTGELLLTSYELRNVKNNEISIVAKLVNQNPGPLLPISKRAILPDKPLDLGTEYLATVVGTNAGVPFTKACKFTTATK